MGRAAVALPGAGPGLSGLALWLGGGRPRGSHVKPGAILWPGYAWLAQY